MVSTYDGIKLAADDLREVREMRRTCEMRHVCMGYFVLFVLLHEKISRVSHLEPCCGRCGNYARDKGIFSCDKG